MTVRRWYTGFPPTPAPAASGTVGPAAQHRQSMRCILIPADNSEPIVEHHVAGWGAMRQLLGGYIETLVTRELAAFAATCGVAPYLPRFDAAERPGLVLCIDEDGHPKALPANLRASIFYPGGVVGPAILLGEGLVDSEDGFFEVDTISLPDTVTVADVASHVEP